MCIIVLCGEIDDASGMQGIAGSPFGGGGKGQQAVAEEKSRPVGKSKITNNVVTRFAKFVMRFLYGVAGKLSEKHIGL